MNSLHERALSKALVLVLWCRGLMFISTAQHHSKKPDLSSAQVQILLAAYRRFTMVRTADNIPGRK